MSRNTAPTNPIDNQHQRHQHQTNSPYENLGVKSNMIDQPGPQIARRIGRRIRHGFGSLRTRQVDIDAVQHCSVCVGGRLNRFDIDFDAVSAG